MYWSHFGLDRQPFRSAVDPDSYFPVPSHEEAIAALAGAFARRDAAVLIDGPAGVGKSLVSRKWLEHLLSDVPRVIVPNTHAERPAALLQAILFDLGKPYQGCSEQELRLSVTEQLLALASESNFPTVLLLDEAQHLGDSALEELRMLGNLETRRGSALFAVLVAQPSLREELRRPALELFSQRLGALLAVEPLTEMESADYLRHQVRAAGGEPDKVFDEDVVRLIAEACGGIPRLLNRAAAISLELTANARADQVDVEAGLEALDRLGLTPTDPDRDEDLEADGELAAVLLPHPSRAAEPSGSKIGKSVVGSGKDEESVPRGPKDKASRKRSV